MAELAPLEEPQKLIVRGTNRHKGRHISITPSNSAMCRLTYGRILLDPELSRVRFDTGTNEVALICLGGGCSVRVDGRERHELTQYDAIYLPRNRAIEVSTTGRVDLVECSAEVEHEYPVQVVRYTQVVSTPALKFSTGGPSTTREVNILIGSNVKAGRLLCGFTKSASGNWTSWPPHEHSSLLEEMYVYFEMEPPSFGVQFVYTDAGNPEFVGVVRDGDAVLMPRGYHPNVSVPGHSINFVWLMAAHREVDDRVYGVVNVQPEFKATPSGLDSAKR